MSLKQAQLKQAQLKQTQLMPGRIKAPNGNIGFLGIGRIANVTHEKHHYFH